MSFGSSSRTLTLPVQRERFAQSRVSSRSTEPEVFTFERVPAQATALRSTVPLRPRRRCTRVMYPAKVRMHLPPPEKSRAKRWLLVLVLVLLWQIYTEEPCADSPLGCDGPASDPRRFPLQCPEQRTDLLPAAQTCNNLDRYQNLYQDQSHNQIRDPDQILPGEEAESRYEQSAGKSCVMALLVYHHLGGDK